MDLEATSPSNQFQPSHASKQPDRPKHSDYPIVSPKMQLFNVIALFAGIAVAAPTLTERDGPGGPSGHEVEIKDFTYGGTGCPDHSVASMLSDDRTTLTLIYDNFVAESGEKVSPRERRKNCQLNVKLHYPQGWQFSVFKADYRGYAYLPHGFSGTCSATYYFSGSSKQARLVEPTS